MQVPPQTTPKPKGKAKGKAKAKAAEKPKSAPKAAGKAKSQSSKKRPAAAMEADGGKGSICQSWFQVLWLFQVFSDYIARAYGQATAMLLTKRLQLKRQNRLRKGLPQRFLSLTVVRMLRKAKTKRVLLAPRSSTALTFTKARTDGGSSAASVKWFRYLRCNSENHSKMACNSYMACAAIGVVIHVAEQQSQSGWWQGSAEREVGRDHRISAAHWLVVWDAGPGCNYCSPFHHVNFSDVSSLEGTGSQRLGERDTFAKSERHGGSHESCPDCESCCERWERRQDRSWERCTGALRRRSTRRRPRSGRIESWLNGWDKNKKERFLFAFPISHYSILTLFHSHIICLWIPICARCCENFSLTCGAVSFCQQKDSLAKSVHSRSTQERWNFCSHSFAPDTNLRLMMLLRFPLMFQFSFQIKIWSFRLQRPESIRLKPVATQFSLNMPVLQQDLELLKYERLCLSCWMTEIEQ